ncbi:alcohol acetyltransferase domain-containing protein [Trichoderma sp. SZMC 28014]
MAIHEQFLRFASGNEQRSISREDLGFYHAVIVGALYEFGDDVDAYSPSSYYQPLRQCIEEHAYLSVAIGDAHTDKAFYYHVLDIRLEQHVVIADHTAPGDDLSGIQKVFADDLDKPFPSDVPPWRVTVLPLQTGCFIAFSYSHSIGDGWSGAVFHHTLLNAFRKCSTSSRSVDSLVKLPPRPLSPPFDTAERLPISWSYLIAPLFAMILPTFVTKLLRLRVSVSAVDTSTWTGSLSRFDAETHRTKVVVYEIEAPLLSSAIRAARGHDAKLTATFHGIVSRALSRAIPDPKYTNFASLTAVNMRRSIGIPPDEMGNFVSGAYMNHPRDDTRGDFSDDFWAAARLNTHKLMEAASALSDQPVGLLRYLLSIRKWLAGRIGKQRDSSYEVSNIGSFDADSRLLNNTDKTTRITKMAFSQPGHVASSAMAFNLASVKDGNLIYSVTWQQGALGIDEDKEDDFVHDICAAIRQDLESL